MRWEEWRKVLSAADRAYTRATTTVRHSEGLVKVQVTYISTDITGVGKTNLAVSIGIEAAKHRYCVYFITFQDLISQLKKASNENRLDARIKFLCRYKLLIIDELGYQKMDVDSANLFFNLIAKRYEKSSTVITTNSPFSKWADIFQEPVLTNALLDRLLHHSHVITIKGPSYRMTRNICHNYFPSYRQR